MNRKNLILIPVTTQIQDSPPGNFKIFSVKEDELNLVDSCRCKMLILLSWLDIKKDYFVSTRYEELINCT